MLLVSIIYLLLVSHAAVNGAEWIHYESNADGNKYYYDKESITSGERGIIKAWEKIVFSKEGKQDRIKKLKQGEVYKEDYENLSYTLGLVAYNCNTKKSCPLSLANYTPAGNIIDSYTRSLSEGRWEPIPPNSVNEKLYEILCKDKR